MPKFKVEVREERVFELEVTAADVDNARWLASEKLRELRKRSTTPPSQHVRDMPMSSWEVTKV